MFVSPEKYPFLSEFKRHFDSIKEELMNNIDKPLRALNENTWAGERPNYLSTPSTPELAWKTFTFRFFGINHSPNLKVCPTIAQLLHQHPEIVTAEFSMLEPQTHILPHRGFTDQVLRAHLGLIIPEGNTGIKVLNEKKRWEEGDFLVFNDRLLHEAWNNTQERRVVLMLDFVPPDHLTGWKTVCRETLSATTDDYILSLAPRETWMEWLKEGKFPAEAP